MYILLQGHLVAVSKAIILIIEHGKYNKLGKDVQATFDHETGIEMLLISEFGDMFQKLSNVEEIFTTLLAELDLTFVHLEVMPSYVA